MTISDQTLTTVRRNEVFEAVQAAGLDPGLLEWVIYPTRRAGGFGVSRLRLRQDHDFFFQFDYEQGKDWTFCSPGAGPRMEESFPGSWGLQMENAYSWAGRLADELEARDLWGELTHYLKLGAFVTPDADGAGTISADEVDEIRAAVGRLEEVLAETYKLGREQRDFVRDRLEFLADAARTQSRFGWVHTAIGVTATIAWAISPDDVDYYWSLVRTAFQSVKLLLVAG